MNDHEARFLKFQEVASEIIGNSPASTPGTQVSRIQALLACLYLLGLNMQDIATACGVTKQAVSLALRGDRSFRIESYLSSLVNLTPDLIFDRIPRARRIKRSKDGPEDLYALITSRPTLRDRRTTDKDSRTYREGNASEPAKNRTRGRRAQGTKVGSRSAA